MHLQLCNDVVAIQLEAAVNDIASMITGSPPKHHSSCHSQSYQTVAVSVSVGFLA